MSLQVRYCPHCGTRRTGYFRFCGRCGLDFDELTLARPEDATAPKAEPKPEPTTPIWPPPPQWPPPNAMPSAAVRALTERAAAAAPPAGRSAVVAPAVAPVEAPVAPPAEPATPAAPVVPAPAPPIPPAIDWPSPETRPASRQVPEARPLLARPLSAPPAASVVAKPAGAVEPVPRGSVIPSLPLVTWTRLLIIGLGALLAANAVANALTRSTTAVSTPLPTTVLATPLVVDSAGPSTGGASSESPAGVGSSFGPTSTTQVATVTRIVDGDTIHVEINGTDYRVRYIGMDTPEPTSTDPVMKALADKATAQNAALVEGKEIYLERDISDTDQYGRLLRDIWLVDGGGSMVLINLELVRLGYAQVTTFPPDVKYVDQLLAAQSKAKADRVGLWAP